MCLGKSSSDLSEEDMCLAEFYVNTSVRIRKTLRLHICSGRQPSLPARDGDVGPGRGPGSGGAGGRSPPL